jgi:hypothetical protein
LPIARRQRVDLVVAAGEAQREPFLPLAAKFREAMGGRAVIRRKLVCNPVGLAEMLGTDSPGLFPELAHDRIAWVLVGVDAALRHLPFEAGQNDFRPVVPEAAADQYLTRGVEQRDPDIWAIGFI